MRPQHLQNCSNSGFGVGLPMSPARLGVPKRSKKPSIAFIYAYIHTILTLLFLKRTLMAGKMCLTPLGRPWCVSRVSSRVSREELMTSKHCWMITSSRHRQPGPSKGSSQRSPSQDRPCSRPETSSPLDSPPVKTRDIDLQ